MTPMAKNFNQQFRRELQRAAPKDIQERLTFYEQRLLDRREAKRAQEAQVAAGRQETESCF